MNAYAVVAQMCILVDSYARIRRRDYVVKPTPGVPGPAHPSDATTAGAAPAAVRPRRGTPKTGAGRSPAREGQTLVGGFFSPLVHRQLKVLAAEQGKSQQALIGEALNMIFAKYGKPEIAASTRLLQAS